MSWKKLDKLTASEFVTSVGSPDEPVIFDPSLCEVHRLPLSFYDGYYLYRIINRHMMPCLLLDYLSNGEHHYYMDGSDQAFHNMNVQGALSLNERNVKDYVDLYISYVYERGNSLDFIRDPHRLTHKGSAAMDMHFRAITQHQAASVGFDATNGTYTIVTPLIYQDQTLQSRIVVNRKGRIDVKEPLEVSFLTELKPVADIPYRHPAESKIIEESMALLAGLESTERLLALTREKAFSVRVLTSCNYQGFITHEPVGYIVMPAAQQSANYVQALMLYELFRYAEHIYAGYIHPHPEQEKEMYAEVNYAKNLDVTLQMCKIVEEYESRNIPEPLNELRRMGLESVYSGYKNGLDNEALMKAYVASLERYDIIKGKER